MIIDVYNKWSGPCNAMNSLLKKMRVQFQVRKIAKLLLSIHYEPIMGNQKYLFCGFFQPFKKNLTYIRETTDTKLLSTNLRPQNIIDYWSLILVIFYSYSPLEDTCNSGHDLHEHKSNEYKTSVNKFKTPTHHRLLKSDFGGFLFLYPPWGHLW